MIMIIMEGLQIVKMNWRQVLIIIYGIQLYNSEFYRKLKTNHSNWKWKDQEDQPQRI